MSAAALIENSSPLFMMSSFTNNSHPSGGIVLVIEGSNPTFDGCNFESNSGLSRSPSSALEISGYGTSKVTNCTFSRNRSPAGAAAVVGVRAAVLFSSCDFTSNIAETTSPGGALLINSTDFPATLHACTFMNNKAHIGGAIHLSTGSQMKLSSCKLMNNSASDMGGAVSTGPNVKLQVVDCQFKNNTANSFGGAISMGESARGISNQPIQTRLYFGSNTASYAGGAVYWHFGTPVALQVCLKCSYEQNRVGRGGYGPDQAGDVAGVRMPATSQQAFYPGVPTGNSSFFLHLIDSFNQVVVTSLGTGVRCSLRWSPSAKQFGGDSVRFSQLGVVTFPEVRIASSPGASVTAGFNCSSSKCSALDRSLVEHQVYLTEAVNILRCNLGEYSEMEKLVEQESDSGTP